MNFRLFRSSLLLLSILLISNNWVNANSITGFSYNASKQFENSHSNKQEKVCIPFELTEDNEVNGCRKRFSSTDQTIIYSVEIFSSNKKISLFYYNYSSGFIQAIPNWLINRVILI